MRGGLRFAAFRGGRGRQGDVAHHARRDDVRGERRTAESLAVKFQPAHHSEGTGAGLIERQTRQGALRSIAAGRQRLVQQERIIQ